MGLGNKLAARYMNNHSQGRYFVSDQPEIPGIIYCEEAISHGHQKNRQLRSNIRSAGRRIHRLAHKVQTLQESIEELQYAIVLAKAKKSDK